MASSTRAGRQQDKRLRLKFTSMSDEQLRDAVEWRIRQVSLTRGAGIDSDTLVQYGLECLAALDLLVDRLVRPPLAF